MGQFGIDNLTRALEIGSHSALADGNFWTFSTLQDYNLLRISSITFFLRYSVLLGFSCPGGYMQPP